MSCVKLARLGTGSVCVEVRLLRTPGQSMTVLFSLYTLDLLLEGFQDSFFVSKLGKLKYLTVRVKAKPLNFCSS